MVAQAFNLSIYEAYTTGFLYIQGQPSQQIPG